MRGYTLIEPDIHRKLNWDLDLIVKCLEVIRLQMPQILSQGAAGVEYDLIAVGNPHGPPYPAIGVHCPKESDLSTIPDWPQIDDITNQWVEKMGLDTLKKKAVDIDYIDWDRLKDMRTFTNREK
jgi:hypothetical protein